MARRFTRRSGGRIAEDETDGIETLGRPPARIAAMNAALSGLMLWSEAITVSLFHAVRARSIVKCGEILKRLFIVFISLPYKPPGHAKTLA